MHVFAEQGAAEKERAEGKDANLFEWASKRARRSKMQEEAGKEERARRIRSKQGAVARRNKQARRRGASQSKEGKNDEKPEGGANKSKAE